MLRTSLKIGLCLLVVLTPGWLGGAQTSNGAPSINITSQPQSPLVIESVEPMAPPSNLPADYVVYRIRLRNNSAANIAAFAVRWDWPLGVGRAHHGFTKRLALEWNHPAIAAGQELMLKPGFRAAAHPSVNVSVDSVLLQDGTSFGADKSHTLEEFDSMLFARQRALEWALSVLESQGGEALARAIHEELANEKAEAVYSHLKPAAANLLRP